MANNQLDNLDDLISSKNSLHMSRLTGGKKKKRKTTKRKTKKSKKTKRAKKTKKMKKIQFSSPQARLFHSMA